MDAHKNFAYTTVATAPSPASSGLSLVVAAATGSLFPAAPFNATVWPANTQPLASNAEIVRVTAVATDTLTIVRAQENSSARSIGVGDQIAATVTAKTLTDVEGALTALSSVYQPLDSDLTAIAALTTTTFGRAVLALADAAALRTAAGLGTAATSNTGDFDTAGAAAAAQAASQPLDSDLTAIAALTTTSFGRAFLALADAAAARTALGLGTLATQSGTFSGTSSGTNTGDQTSVSGNAGTATALQTGRTIDGQTFDGTANITVIAPGTHAATGKTTPVDADELSLVDSAASNVLKKLTWANLKATVKAYTDTLYPSGSGTSSGTNTGDQTLPTDATITTTDVTTNNVSSTKHGWAPKSASDATKFLNSAATPAYAAVKDSDLSVSDVTTNNASTSQHGFAPKLDNNSAHFLNGQGGWTTPAGGSADKLGLTPTAVKTAGYSAAVGDFVPVDTTSGAVTVTLPTAPADGSVIAMKHVIQGGTNAVTYATGGSDVLNKASGATSGTLPVLAQSVVLQYKSSGAIWYIIAGDTPVSQLDLRYPAGSGTSTGTNTGDQTDATLTTSDVTTNNSSTSKHGFLKKLDNTASHYMDGTGAWSTPAGGGVDLQDSIASPLILGAAFAPNSASSVGASNNLKIVRVVMPKAGTLHDISVWVSTSSGNVSIAVYDTGDSSAGNYTRLATSGAVACGSANAWMTYDPSLVVTAGQNLLFAVSADNTTATFGIVGVNNGLASVLPASFIPTAGGAGAKAAGVVTTSHPAPTSFSEASVVGTGSGGIVVLIGRVA